MPFNVRTLKFELGSIYTIPFPHYVYLMIYPNAKGSTEIECMSAKLYKMINWQSVTIMEVSYGNKNRLMEFFTI